MFKQTRLAFGAALLALVAGIPAQAHILWGNEHQARAEALGKAYTEKSSAVPADRKAVTSSDKTLTVWGHGSQTTFSEMTDAQFVELVKNWKTKNSALETVEIVTCDARHAQNRDLDAFAGRVKTLMGAEASLRGVKLKGLPIGQHADDVSILWANAGTSTFCYITAPDQRTFDAANTRLQALEGTVTPKYDLSIVGNEMAKDASRHYTLNYSGLKILRASLVEIR